MDNPVSLETSTLECTVSPNDMQILQSFQSTSRLSILQHIACLGLWLFLVTVGFISIWHGSILFLSRHGWTHRLLGGLMLLWLFLGACCCCYSMIVLKNRHDDPSNEDNDDDIRTQYYYWWFGYDIILGLLGTGATLTAAREFPHRHVRNEKGQSGTLHQKAIVTQSEMIEHDFYQGLNLIQAIYLHLVVVSSRRVDDDGETSTRERNIPSRLLLLFLVTYPWYFRAKLPVHSFSDNWKEHERRAKQRQTREGNKGFLSLKQQNEELFLYKIKKWQYVFYKHVILHGLNLFVAVSDHLPPSTSPPYSFSWRVFWLLLNTSYVMEFFLQSLVKRRTIINQSTMLVLQRCLMTYASLGAVVFMIQVDTRGTSDHPPGKNSLSLWFFLSLASLTLNFTNRYHDVLNTMSIACAALAIVWKYPSIFG